MQNKRNKEFARSGNNDDDDDDDDDVDDEMAVSVFTYSKLVTVSGRRNAPTLP